MFQTAHNVISNIINEALVKLSSDDFDHESLWAVAIGAVMGMSILAILSAFPGAGGGSLEVVEEVGGRPEPTTGTKTENHLPDKREETQRNDLEQTSSNTDTISIFQILNTSVYVLLLGGVVYFMNRDYDDMIKKWFVRTFPREADTLGLHVEL